MSTYYNREYTLKNLEKETKDFFESCAEKGFELRQGQVDISRAIIARKSIAAEAEVGIGKSYAYLVPMLRLFKSERRQIVISTSTIALQEQLASDVKKVSNMLGVNAEIVTAKGMGNFACIMKAMLVHRKIKNDKTLKIYNTVKNGRQQRNELGVTVSDKEWRSISVSNYGGDLCKKCQYFSCCQYDLMRKKLLAGSNIAICNHNMLIAHLQNQEIGRKGIFSCTADSIVIDEAHNLESRMRNAFTRYYLYSDIERITNSVIKLVPKNRRATAERFSQSIQAIASKLYCIAKEQIEVQTAETYGDMSSFFYECNDDTAKLLAYLRANLSAMDKLLNSVCGTDRSREYEKYADMYKFFRDVEEYSDKNIVWLEKDGGIKICICKKDIRSDISNLMFKHGKTVVLTSATISDCVSEKPEKRCGYFLDSIGFPSSGIVSEPKKSPFDYDKNTRLYCSDVLPYPKPENKDIYRQKSIDEIVKLLNVTKGKALILFTAKSDMEYVYKKLSNMHLPYKILVQSKSASQQYQLNRFKNDADYVILGTGTYWEGINVEGKSLSQVIIYKLPSPFPTR